MPRGSAPSGPFPGLRPRPHDLARRQQHPPFAYRRHHAHLHLLRDLQTPLRLPQYRHPGKTPRHLRPRASLRFHCWPRRHAASRLIADISLAISAVGLIVLLVAARSLSGTRAGLFNRLPVNPKLAKSVWINLALDATGRLGVVESLLLLLLTVIIWTCEGMIFASASACSALRRSYRSLARRLLCEPLLPHPQLSRRDRPLRARCQDLSRQLAGPPYQQAVFGLAFTHGCSFPSLARAESSSSFTASVSTTTGRSSSRSKNSPPSSHSDHAEQATPKP